MLMNENIPDRVRYWTEIIVSHSLEEKVHIHIHQLKAMENTVLQWQREA